MVCIDPAPNSNVKKACKPMTVSMSGGQGAPVSVVKIDQKSSNKKTVFTITIKHTKKNTMDEIYDLYSLDKCNPNFGIGNIVKTTDKNVVYVNSIILSKMDITQYCSPNSGNMGKIMLDDAGNGYITCIAPLDFANQPGAYTAPLEIELWYGYSKSIYKTVNIKRI